LLREVYDVRVHGPNEIGDKAMRRQRIVIIAVAVLLLIAAGVGWWYLGSHPEIQAQLLADLGLETEVVAEGVLAASGIVEAEEVSVTTETGGRVTEVLADEGDLVQEGDVVIRLDDAILGAQIAEAEAAVETAEASLAQVMAGVPEAEIWQADAMLAQAEITRDGALQALRDARAARDNPQELEALIDAARTQLAIAELTVEQAIANVRAAEIQQKYFPRTYSQLEEGFEIEIPQPTGEVLTRHIRIREPVLGELRRQGNLANQEAWMAWEALYAAEATRDGARQNLNNLLAMRDNPLQADALVGAAQAQYEMNQANVAVAQAQRDALGAGATEEEIEVAQSLVRQAEAALATLRVLLDETILRAPRTGVVLERTVSLGEIAPPNSSLLTIADLSQVTLTVFVPENQIGLVNVGQSVEVRVDSFPEKAFGGEVVHIASRAEFTPKNVQTKEERVTTVFAVKIVIPNPEHKLKPGMPADAQILVEK
jgi:HlyD family secretion protein